MDKGRKIIKADRNTTKVKWVDKQVRALELFKIKECKALVAIMEYSP